MKLVGKKYILYLGSGNDIVDILKKAWETGLKIIYITEKSKYNANVLPYCEEVFILKYSNKKNIFKTVSKLHRKYSFSSIMSLNESSTLLTAQLREYLSIKGNSYRTSALLKDKYKMRVFLKDISFATGRSEEDIQKFLKAVQKKIIIKPKNESGSFMIHRLENAQEVQKVYSAFHECKIKNFLMEEYIEGKEFSVETFSFEGKHQVIAITEKFTNEHHVEVGHLVSARISQKMNKKIGLFVEQFLTQIKFHQGPAHTEVKYHKGVVKIIESHDRTGGDRINLLVFLSTGIDMRKKYFEMIKGSFVFPFKKTRAQSAAILFFTPKVGAIKEIKLPVGYKNMKGYQELRLLKNRGDYAEPVLNSSHRAGHIIATGENPQQALKNCKKIFKEFKWVTE